MATNLFSLVARLTLDDDEYKSKINQNVSSAKSFGTTLTKTVKRVSIATTAALTASAAAVGKIIKDAVKAYAEYEQLVGGVETLFGAQGMSIEEYAKSQGKSVSAVQREYKILMKTQQEVLNNADDAYKTAGMSANEYMQAVMGFSASLIKSLGGDTKAAAEMADMAMQDIADNANKFGVYTAQELSNVYQALARGNYQTLDNLQLGYAGTKDGMDQLIKDAMKYDKNFKVLTKTTKKGTTEMVYSYDDMVKAIHIVQNEMGITGTTAREAENTIQGSLSMTKAAWENLLVALGSGEGLKKAIDNLVNSGIAAFKNIMPVVMNALDGIGELIQQVAPIIAENLPKLVQDVLPKLLDAAVSLLMGLVAALPGMFQVVLDAIGSLVDTLRDYLYERITELGQVFDNVIAAWNDTIKPAFEGIINFFKDIFKGDWAAAWEDIKGAFVTIWDGLSDWFGGIFERAKEHIAQIEWAQLGTDIWNWIVAAFSEIVSFFTDLYTSAAEAIESIEWEAVGEWVWDAIASAFDSVVQFFTDLFGGEDEEGVVGAVKGIDWKGLGKAIWSYIKAAFDMVVDFFKGLFKKVWVAIEEKIDWKKLGEDIWNWIIEAFASIVDFYTDLYNDAADAIKSIEWKEVGQWIWDAIVAAFNGVVEWFKKLFGDEEGGVADAIVNIDWKGLGESILNLITSAFEGIWDVFSTIFENAWDAIVAIEWADVGTAIWDAITGVLQDIGEWILDIFRTPINAVIDMVNSMIGGVEGAFNSVVDGLNKLNFTIGGDEIFGVKIPKYTIGISGLRHVDFGRIQELATGGFLSNGQRAIVGEYRPEMLSMVNGHALVTPIGGIKPGDRMGGGNTYNNNMTIVQQPGESSEELAERIQEVFVRWQRQEDAVWA